MLLLTNVVANMGYHVNLTVTFQWDEYETLHPLAMACLPDVRNKGVRQAEWFLSEVLARKGTLPGPKGGICTWGMVCNGLDAEGFLAALGPFWLGIIGSHNKEYARILVMAQGEADMTTSVFEIFREDPDDDHSMTVKKHQCAFQMQFAD
jgi:hypothetical protein